MALSSCVARRAMACAVFSSPLRSDQFFRETNAIPAFWPLPLKLKPSTVKITSVLAFSLVRNHSRTWRLTSAVRTAVAPAGRVYCTMISPWSSVGRKLPGSFSMANPIAPQSRAKITSMPPERRRARRTLF